MEKLTKLYFNYMYHEIHTLSVLLYVLLFCFHRYTAACSKILVQYKVAFKQVQKDFPTVEAFMKTYRVSIGIIIGMILIFYAGSWVSTFANLSGCTYVWNISFNNFRVILHMLTLIVPPH